MRGTVRALDGWAGAWFLGFVGGRCTKVPRNQLFGVYKATLKKTRFRELMRALPGFEMSRD